MALSNNTYAVHLVTKMLDHGMSDAKKSYGVIMSMFSTRHPMNSLVAL